MARLTFSFLREYKSRDYGYPHFDSEHNIYGYYSHYFKEIILILLKRSKIVENILKNLTLKI